MFVRLVDIDGGHVQQLVQALEVVLLDRAVDRRENEVVLLGKAIK